MRLVVASRAARRAAGVGLAETAGAVVVLAAIWAAGVGVMSAQVTTGFGIGLDWQNKDTFDAASAQYNVASETLLVEGSMTLPPGMSSTDFVVLVQNVNATFTAVGASTTNFRFAIRLPMGPTAPALGWAAYAYSQALANQDHVAKPIVADLLEIATGEVKARTRVVIFDKRWNPHLNPKYAGGEIEKSLAMEATGRGLNTLEGLHRRVMPQPSRTEFDGRLTTSFRGFNATETMNTARNNLPGPGNPTPKACVALNEAPSAFLNTAAWTTARDRAVDQYGYYLAAKSFVENGTIPQLIASALPAGWVASIVSVAAAQGIMDASCVRELPVAARFEVCGGSLRGDASSMVSSGISSVNLELGTTGATPPYFTSLSYLNPVDGVINAEARNMFIRYAHEPARACVQATRTSVNIPETQITSNSQLADWRKCTGITLRAMSPHTVAATNYEMEQDNSSSAALERNQMEASSSPNPLFNLGGQFTKDVARGICSLPGFTHNAEALVDRFKTRMKDSLNTVWRQGSPRTQEANALDLIFSRWETGIYGDTQLAGTPTGADHELTHKYNRNESENLQDRFFSFLNTNARSLTSPSPTDWVYAEPDPYACSHDNWGCLANRSPNNTPFDVSYSVTTGALNQVVKELSTSTLLTFDWQPTNDDLGLIPPPGATGSSPAVLTGVTLSNLHGNFESMGNQPVTLRVRPTIMPYTYINPEPPNVPVPVPPGEQKLTYQLAALELDVLTSDGNGGYTLWLRTAIDLFDPELSLSPASNRTLNRLVPEWSSGKSSNATVLRTAFGMCPMGTAAPWPFLGPAPWPQVTCANAMGTILLMKLQPTLEERMLYMLSRFPAPQYFNAGGQASSPLEFQMVDRWQQAQVITFYGNLQ